VIDPRIQEISDAWFVREPLLLMALLSHELRENNQIKSIRSGKGFIEINPAWAAALSKPQLEECLKGEVIRILLKHPYRKPPEFDDAISYMASNITLNEYYPFEDAPAVSEKCTDFWQDEEHRRQNFEFYYRELMKLYPPDSADNVDIDNPNKDDKADDEGEQETTYVEVSRNSAENAELWEEDDFFDQKMNELIRFARENMLSWGTIPGALQQTIIASLNPVLDYRNILRSFRASVLASDKILTRQKPSRRYGFLYMGKRSQFVTRLLVGVDVSGSISDDDLDLFYSTINRFFKYGVPVLDALQFDAKIQGKPAPMKKARKTIAVTGRGGTDFQPIIDFFTAKSGYDGLIIFTDGNAAQPKVPPAFKQKILWLCNSRANFDLYREWMGRLGRTAWIGEG